MNRSNSKASMKYNKTHVKPYSLFLNKRTDVDIIGKLDSSNNKQGYIKNLIRRDISRVEAEDCISMDVLNKAIDYVEDYVCNHEKNTYRAQGMCEALTMIEEYVKEHNNEQMDS